jgi:ribose transport system permease protein
VGEIVVLLGIWLGLFLLFGLFSPNFLTGRTLSALANRVPYLTVVSVGMTLVLIIGGIDLSVGSVLGLCGAVLGVAMVDWRWPLSLGAVLSLLVGLAAGFVNGFLSVGMKIPSFIVTLGMLEIARGLAYLTTHSQTKYIGAGVEGLAKPIGALGCSPAFLVALAVMICGQVLLKSSLFGRHLFAIGGNEQAAHYAGINTRTPKVAVFALLGSLTGLSAVFYTSYLGSSDPNAGVGFELAAIASVVIGGTSLVGGRGSVVKSFLGVLIITTLEAGLAQVGASEPAKRVITGAVIVLAVVLDAWRHQWSAFRSTLLQRVFHTS